MNSVKFIMNYVYKYKFLFIAGAFVLAMDTLLNISLTIVQKWIIDYVVLGEYNNVLFFFLIFVVSYIGTCLLFYFKGQIFHKMEYGIKGDLTLDLLNHIYKISYTDFGKFKITKYLSLFEDIDYISNEVFSFPDKLQEIAKIVILIVVISYIDIYATLIVLVISSFYLFIRKYFFNVSKKYSKQIREERSSYFSMIEESIIGTREIIANDNFKWESKLINNRFIGLINMAKSKSTLESYQQLCAEILYWGNNFAIILLGGIQLFKGYISVGTFIVLYQLAIQLVTLINDTYLDLSALSESSSRIDRLRENLNMEEQKPTSKLLEFRQLVFKNVIFSYDSNHNTVINRLNLKINKGEKVGIAGMSGSGKSTIMKLILKQYIKVAGSIQINDINIDNISDQEILSKFAVVYQEPYILPSTVYDNITMGRDITEEKVIEISKALNIYEFIVNLPNGFNTYIGDRGIKLSGGERQRIAIARAIIGIPDILLLDEATSALDVQTERLIQDSIDKIMNRKTVIIIAHRLSTILNSDVIYLIDHGQCICNGTHEELLSKSKLYRNLVFNQTFDN